VPTFLIDSLKNTDLRWLLPPYCERQPGKEDAWGKISWLAGGSIVLPDRKGREQAFLLHGSRATGAGLGPGTSSTGQCGTALLS
jgi:hypothetical protein